MQQLGTGVLLGVPNDAPAQVNLREHLITKANELESTCKNG
jgi:hypothetical protein